MLLARHAGLGLAHFENHVRTFNALHRGGHHLAALVVVFVENRVALGFAYFLEDHLLGNLRGDAPQPRRAGERVAGAMKTHFAAYLHVRIALARFFQGDLQVRVLDLLGHLHDALDRIHVNGSGLFIQCTAQGLLRLQIFARGHSNGIFHRIHYNLRINALLAAQPFDLLIKQTCHNPCPYCEKPLLRLVLYHPSPQ